MFNNRRKLIQLNVISALFPKNIWGLGPRLRVAILITLAFMGLSLPRGAYAADPGFAGQLGPADTKAVVDRSNDNLTVAIIFTPTKGPGRYAVYRYTLYDASTDPNRLWKRSFDHISTCSVSNVVYNADLGVVTAVYLDNGCPSSWTVDTQYNYVRFNDSGITPYNEYYYYVVHELDEGISAGKKAYDPANGNDTSEQDLNKYVISAAFPPTQTRHGSYSEYTNACNACHGLHSSKHVKLLKAPTSTDLCGTCHDGTGSKYDEVRGRVRKSDTWSDSEYAAAGPFGDRLKEGSGIKVTSAHNVTRVKWQLVPDNNPKGDILDNPDAYDNSAYLWQAPGYYYGGDPDSPKRWLVCVSCHEPHNKYKNYRLLRGEINGRRNIIVRGVSATNVYPTDGNPYERGEWEKRYMYTKFLSGGNSSDSQVNELGGVVSFCTACHSAFALGPSPNSIPGLGVYVAPTSDNFNCTGGDCGRSQVPVDPDRVPPGTHKHPVGVMAAYAPAVDAPLNQWGEVCTITYQSAISDDCKQGRVVDPVLPLEGRNDQKSGPRAYRRNLVMCLTCHVPHGSGSERLEVAWKNNQLNETQGGMRDMITGYLWNRNIPDQGFMGSNEYKHPNSPGQISPQWGTGSQEPRFYVANSPYWTQYGFTSALARFNPFASACYRCHSRTKVGP